MVEDRLGRALARIWSEREFVEAVWAVLKPVPASGDAKWVYTDLEVRVDQSGAMWLERYDERAASYEAVLHLAPGQWNAAVRL